MPKFPAEQILTRLLEIRRRRRYSHGRSNARRRAGLPLLSSRWLKRPVSSRSCLKKITTYSHASLARPLDRLEWAEAADAVPGAGGRGRAGAATLFM